MSPTEQQQKNEIRSLVTQLHDDGVSEMWILHFFSHHKTDPSLEEEKDGCHFCQLRASPNNLTFLVGIVNHVSKDWIDPTFRFIEENVVSKGVEFAPEHFLSGCNCKANSNCMTSNCACLQDLEEPLAREDHQYGDDISPYRPSTDGPYAGCLKPFMLNSRRPIYECHKHCKCGKNCASRIVGKGRKVSLQVFRTDDGRGWGLRAMGDIKKGQFIGKYVGELLTPEEAQHRRRMSKAAGKKDIYLFALDKFHDPSSADPRLRREPYEIDGEYMSGPTRFINHSCDPNLRVFAVVNDHANKPVHDLCFFALKDIDRYTELTFDYVDGVDGKKEIGRPRRPSKKESPDPERDGVENECLCGAKNCRGFLWI